MISMKSTYVKCLSFVTCVMKYVQCPLNLFYFRIMFDYNNFSIIKLRKKASRYYDHTHIDKDLCSFSKIIQSRILFKILLNAIAR